MVEVEVAMQGQIDALDVQASGCQPKSTQELGASSKGTWTRARIVGGAVQPIWPGDHKGRL